MQLGRSGLLKVVGEEAIVAKVERVIQRITVSGALSSAYFPRGTYVRARVYGWVLGGQEYDGKIIQHESRTVEGQGW